MIPLDGTPLDRVMYYLITAVPPSVLGVDFISQAAYQRAAALMADRMASEGIIFAPSPEAAASTT